MPYAIFFKKHSHVGWFGTGRCDHFQLPFTTTTNYKSICYDDQLNSDAGKAFR